MAEILATTTSFLAKKDPSCPRLEAELLLSKVLKLDRVELYLNFERVLTLPEVDAYRELVKRRGNHEPVAYILGHKKFYTLDLKVNPSTLIPRPETEHLVDEALRLLCKGTKDEKVPIEGTDTAQTIDLEDEIETMDEIDDDFEGEADTAAYMRQAQDDAPIAALPPLEVSREQPDEEPEEASIEPPLVADIGTGSGAIALALLSAHHRVRVVATDISPEALNVARENAVTHKLNDRVTFLTGNLAEPLAGQRFDIVCANLPYVPGADMATLAPDVANFEPLSALEGGPEGLSLIEKLLFTVKPILKDNGYLLLEIWPASAPKLRQLSLEAGLVPLDPILDYSKKARIFVAHNQAPASN